MKKGNLRLEQYKTKKFSCKINLTHSKRIIRIFGGDLLFGNKLGFNMIWFSHLDKSYIYSHTNQLKKDLKSQITFS